MIDLIDQFRDFGITVIPLEVVEVGVVDERRIHGQLPREREGRAFAWRELCLSCAVDREDRVIVDAQGAETVACLSQRIPRSVGAGRYPGELGFQLG
jgi:hypothetical protein